MNCWNCGEQLAADTKICRRCEADQTEHVELDPQTVEHMREIIESMAPGALEALPKLVGPHDTAEDFANAVLIGPCPECHSENVGDCVNDPDYENFFLGRCFACGNVWCVECGYKLKKGEKQCPDEAEHALDYPGLEDLE